jgi:hypothetical protein
MEQPAEAVVIQAAVAGVGPDRVVAAHDERHERGVRFLLGRQRRQPDHRVRLVGDRLQQAGQPAGVVLAEFAKDMGRGGDHLIGSHAPAGASAHAVGDHRQQALRVPRAGEDGDPILLLGAVADVVGSAGGNLEVGHGHCARRDWTVYFAALPVRGIAAG